MIYKRLHPVRPPQFEIEAIEKRLKKLFWELVYQPLLHADTLSETILNEAPAYPGLELALSTGRLTYHQGVFSGKFNASATRELKSLGAIYDFKDGTFRLLKDKLPPQINQAVTISESRFVQKLHKLDTLLVQTLHKKPWEHFLFSDLFDKSIFRMDKEFRKNVESITVQPEVTAFQAKQISTEWQNNFRKSIEGFTKKEIRELREQVRESYFRGDRYGSLIQSIQRSYDVTDRKAEFLARQETKLLSAAYQGARYVEAGLPGYLWKAVEGTAAHPTRHRHRELSQMSDRGKVFYWSDPPVTTEAGQPQRRNNPGEDYGCRCSAIPVVEKRK